ncbi:flagellar basal body P-ring formation chaperone FlgA [Rhizobium sp. LCM 4573]|uniref:flagellar basal body P-ring formation chaperone FlgA n=1 Tax=Rhizobium sp. LCM 4573 TaxID=1848291 RepID=UPI0008D94664|nr:flagellar basal body P-ring formation chaperone FlgA [Rhizobium sp. LCM 4573]OHV83517.1 flagella basal body P-ring formation protein FlgA [Rhizobium sp. LCM 4573]
MMFRRKNRIGGRLALPLLAALLVLAGRPALADMGFAVVPTQTIYPGEVISAARVEEVEVTNPNLTGDYARSTGEVVGMVSKRTLLPGRIVLVSALRAPYAVTRGSAVRLTFAIGNLAISAGGSPLEDGAVGDVIRVRNTDSGITVSGTVMADGTIQVMAK